MVFLLVFGQTGLLFLFFIPGNSLLFSLGAMARLETSVLDLRWLLLAVVSGGVLGNFLNYFLGKKYGRSLLSRKQKELVESHFAKHGSRTVILAPFIPNIRTLAPFFAGTTYGCWSQFKIHTFIGISSWALSFLLLGAGFGDIPAVQENIHYVIYAMFVIFLAPSVLKVVLSRV